MNNFSCILQLDSTAKFSVDGWSEKAQNENAENFRKTMAL